MMGKLTMVAAGAVGYVLGTRAGRDRYEQIKTGAAKLARDPRVREKAKEAGGLVKENAPVVKDKVAGAATAAKEAAREKTSSHGGAPVTGVDASSNSSYPAS